MIVIWRGYGWLAPIVVFGSFVLTQLSVNALAGSELYYQTAKWPVRLAAVAAGVLLIGLGLLLNYFGPKKAGKEVVPPFGLDGPHQIFFIPLELAGAMACGIGDYILLCIIGP